MVAGDHRDLDAGVVALLDRRGHLAPRRVEQAEDADVGHGPLELLSLVGLVRIQVAERECERAVAGRRQPGVRLVQARAQSVVHLHGLAAQQRVGAQGQHHVRAALHVGERERPSIWCTVVMRLRSESKGTSPTRFGRNAA